MSQKIKWPVGGSNVRRRERAPARVALGSWSARRGCATAGSLGRMHWMLPPKLPISVTLRPGDSSVRTAMNYRLGWMASLALLGGISCAFAQGTKQFSNPIVVYPTIRDRPLDNPQPPRTQYIYPNVYSPYNGVVRLRRTNPRYR
jgi:hypothetical protein